MRRSGRLVAAFVLALGLAGEAAACPNCKEAVAAQPSAVAAMKNGYNWSVLFMMAMPFTLFGTGALMVAAGLIAATGSGIVGAATPLAPPDKQPENLRLPKPPGKKTGYAIVGLGSLALGQILPAFAASASRSACRQLEWPQPRRDCNSSSV